MLPQLKQVLSPLEIRRMSNLSEQTHSDILFHFYLVLETEPGASCMLDKHFPLSYTPRLLLIDNYTKTLIY